jgi:hypothetical protein
LVPIRDRHIPSFVDDSHPLPKNDVVPSKMSDVSVMEENHVSPLLKSIAVVIAKVVCRGQHFVKSKVPSAQKARNDMGTMNGFH